MGAKLLLKFWHKIYMLIYYFTCEVIKLPWQYWVQNFSVRYCERICPPWYCMVIKWYLKLRNNFTCIATRVSSNFASSMAAHWDSRLLLQ